MIEKHLKITEGVTPEAFATAEAAPPGDAAPEQKEPDPNASPIKTEEKKEEPIIKNVVYRQEVTREPKMKFFKVPKLGCYLAVPLVYASCLFTESLDAAIADYIVYREKVKKNEELMKEYNEKLAEQKAQQEEANAEDKSIDKSKEAPPAKKADKSMSKSAIPEPGDQPAEENKLEPPKLEEAKEPEYKTKPISYVVCMDTLGQDREFTPEQKTEVLNTIKRYKEKWEQHEKEMLTNDRKSKEEEKEKDAEFADKILPGLQEEEDKAVDEKVAVIPEEAGEEEKKAKEKLLHWEHKIKHIATGALKEKVLSMQKYVVVKMPRIMQTLFYLLGFERENICEPSTNKLFWKKARTYWNEALLDKLQGYTPVGPKEGKYKKYQLINFLEKNLEGINDEDVKNYSLGLFKLFETLKLTLEIRKEDILRRKAKREKLAKEREEAIQKSEERTKARAEELRVKKEEALNVFFLIIYT